MLYSLTDKLKFKDHPQIQIRDVIVTVKSDAMSVLKLIDVMGKTNEMEGAVQAASILFSEEDLNKIEQLSLKFEDYMKFVQTAVTLAIGEDPDKESSGEEQSHTTT